MKKIGIITIHKSPNYGACLQSYALYKYLEMQGCNVEVIDLYRPVEFDGYINSEIYKRSRKPVLSWKMRIKKLFGLNKENTDANRYSPIAFKKFNDFNSEILLSKPYKSVEQLYLDPPIYELYITGSDQVWNPTQNYCIEPYFLTFVPTGIGKKISYASSIGINELTNEEKEKFKFWLKTYDSISVREKQAKQLLEQFVPTNIHQVPDPTFLLPVNYWKTLAVYPSIDKYILLFSLRFSPLLLEYCLKLSIESGLKLIVLGQIQPKVKDASYIAITDAGPREFLGYIEKANMVITDSFHCTVFSILLGANNFFTYISPYNKRGSRITDLLESFDLSEHLLHTSLNDSYNSLINNCINKENINVEISKSNQKARSYLDEFIKNN